MELKKCTRCRKEIPEGQEVHDTIIGRDRKQVYDSRKGRYVSKAVVTQQRLVFCSQTCADHEQWSREG